MSNHPAPCTVTSTTCLLLCLVPLLPTGPCTCTCIDTSSPLPPASAAIQAHLHMLPSPLPFAPSCLLTSTISLILCSMLEGWSPTGTRVMPGRSTKVMVL